MTLITFLFFLGILIFFHELGHFLAAKKVGLQVEEFALGFPPRIFKKQISGTVYSIGLILFGGFVKLKGEDDPKDKEGFWGLAPNKRLLIILSGVFFNIILAYFLISFSLLISYPTEGKDIFVSGFLSKESIAYKNLKIGDKILYFKINDQIFEFEDIKTLSKFLKENKGKEAEIFFQRENKIMSFKATLPAGFYISSFSFKKIPFPYNFYKGFLETFNFLGKFAKGFGIIFKDLISFKKPDLEVVGPVGIYNLFDNFKQFGIGYLLYFVAVLSLNLAIINAFPFPALDGSRAFFVLLEYFKIKKIDYLKEELIHKIGFIILFILLILVTFRDISKILWPK
jgi:regulator of sigma E protease